MTDIQHLTGLVIQTIDPYSLTELAPLKLEESSLREGDIGEGVVRKSRANFILLQIHLTPWVVVRVREEVNVLRPNDDEIFGNVSVEPDVDQEEV